MSYDYTPDSGATHDLYSGRTVTDPVSFGSYESWRNSARYGASEWMREILACIRAHPGEQGYVQPVACASGLTTGWPVVLSGAGTAGTGNATTATKAQIVGFVRSRTAADTGVLVSHFHYATGLTGGTAGDPVYLNDSGTYSPTPGTVRKTLGYYLGATTGLLFAPNVLDAQATGAVTGDHLSAGLVSGLLTGVASGFTSAQTGTANFQLLTASGANASVNALVECWIGDTGSGWETSLAAPTGFTGLTGNVADTPTAGKRIRMISSATGQVQVRIETDQVRAWTFNVAFAGRVYSATITFT